MLNFSFILLFGCLLENAFMLQCSKNTFFSYCLLLQHLYSLSSETLRFGARLFEVPLPKSPVCSDWSVSTGLSVSIVFPTYFRWNHGHFRMMKALMARRSHPGPIKYESYGSLENSDMGDWIWHEFTVYQTTNETTVCSVGVWCWVMGNINSEGLWVNSLSQAQRLYYVCY